MRVGQNPSRFALTRYRPARVTVCVLTHIPDQLGYYARRFDVLKLCLASIIQNTAQGTYDLLVFDNGSCGDVVQYLTSLRDDGRVKYLILSSEKIGIYNALKIMFNAAQGELLAYSQDDILFYPAWLDAHLRILDTYPRVGLVSGVPIRFQFRYGNSYLPSYLAEFREVAVTRGKLIPQEWETDFFASISMSATDGITRTRELEDVLPRIPGRARVLHCGALPVRRAQGNHTSLFRQERGPAGYGGARRGNRLGARPVGFRQVVDFRAIRAACGQPRYGAEHYQDK